MSKKGYTVLLPVLLMSLMLFLVVGCAQTPAPPVAEEAVKSAPTVAINPAVAPLDRKAKMVIIGSNFEPGQQIGIVVSAQGQTRSIIGKLCKPEPVPDETGAWITVWTVDRYIRMLGKMADNKGEGIYTLQVIDADQNLLASTPFAFANIAKKPVEEWAAWAQVLLPAPK
ncbi:hypothetical protein ACFLTZ_00995 [Chloroflexota bacterium]